MGFFSKPPPPPTNLVFMVEYKDSILNLIWHLPNSDICTKEEFITLMNTDIPNTIKSWKINEYYYTKAAFIEKLTKGGETI